MNRIKLLIVDDEPLAHNILEGYAQKIDYVEVVGNCYDAISTINFLNKEKVDAILLDIQMPDLTGLELVQTLEKDSPKIIFTTAFTEYALQSFDYDQVLDYLHKPIRLIRFIKSMERLKNQLSLEKTTQTKEYPDKMETDTQNDILTIKDNKVVYKIVFSQIDYIQSWGNYIKVFTEDEKVLVARKTIKDVEAFLSNKGFERIHKSYIVNERKVKAIDGNRVVLPSIVIPIGKSYIASAKKKFIGKGI
ncbi:MAG: LytTR family DNA-binding domain-containing protein [Bacteroidota bacterium]